MTRPSLGITAMELFACNPFRVLGIAVDTPTADVTLTYKKLLDMAAKGDTADYETPYDFDFLPPFSRSEKDENGLCKDRQQRIQMLRIL